MPVLRSFPPARRLLSALVAALPPLLAPLNAGAQPDCGTPGTMTLKKPDGPGHIQTATRVFADGSVAVRARLAVNPDGGVSSYTVGDAGFTYIANGLRPLAREPHQQLSGRQLPPRLPEGRADGVRPRLADLLRLCDRGRTLYRGRQPVRPAGRQVRHRKRSGQARARPGGGGAVGPAGPDLPLDDLGQAPGERRAPLPGCRGAADCGGAVARYLGKLVWVGGAGFTPALALIGDRGPAFGEGSIALHQLLRTGSVTRQKPGRFRSTNAAVRASWP